MHEAKKQHAENVAAFGVGVKKVTWRGQPCDPGLAVLCAAAAFRGRFAIACSGTGTLVGEASLVDCLKVGSYDKQSGLGPWTDDDGVVTAASRKLFLGAPGHFPKHRIADLSIVKYEKVYAWVLEGAVRYVTPVKYKHPVGAVVWVTLTEEVLKQDAVDDDHDSMPDVSVSSSGG